MNVVIDKYNFYDKVNRASKKAVDASIDKLKNRLASYDRQDIRCVANSNYLVHDRYVFKNQLFFTYKTKAENSQIRILCWYDVNNDSIVLIGCYIKKKNKVKYYNAFKEIAEIFYYENIQ